MSETFDHFRTWITSRSSLPFYVSGHRFEKNQNGEVVIDRAVFDLEEAEHVGEMLLSPNPLLKLNAIFAIWEKNGTLLKMILVSTILLLAIAIIVISE